MLRIFVLFLSLFITLNANAYQHHRNLPSDFSFAKCFADPKLIKYINMVGKNNNNLQIIGYVNNFYSGRSGLADQPVYAYSYMCSYINKSNQKIHIWTSRLFVKKINKIDKSHGGETYVYVNGNYYGKPIYNGKTYNDIRQWYNENWDTWNKDEYYFYRK